MPSPSSMPHRYSSWSKGGEKLIRGELAVRIGDRNWSSVCCSSGCDSSSMLSVVSKGTRDGAGGGGTGWGVSTGFGDKRTRVMDGPELSGWLAPPPSLPRDGVVIAYLFRHQSQKSHVPLPPLLCWAQWPAPEVVCSFRHFQFP